MWMFLLIHTYMMGEKWEQQQILFSWAPKSLRTVTAAMKLKDTCSLKEKLMTNLDSILKSRDNLHHLRSSYFEGVALLGWR